MLEFENIYMYILMYINIYIYIQWAKSFTTKKFQDWYLKTKM